MALCIDDMFGMQRELQHRYLGIWQPLSPDLAPQQLLWGVGEIGEMIDIIKKRGDGITSDPAVRRAFIEETCDVLMYLTDVMLCYGIAPDEIERVYRAKHAHNMSRKFEGSPEPSEQ